MVHKDSLLHNATSFSCLDTEFVLPVSIINGTFILIVDNNDNTMAKLNVHMQQLIPIIHNYRIYGYTYSIIFSTCNSVQIFSDMWFPLLVSIRFKLPFIWSNIWSNTITIWMYEIYILVSKVCSCFNSWYAFKILKKCYYIYLNQHHSQLNLWPAVGITYVVHQMENKLGYLHLLAGNESLHLLYIHKDMIPILMCRKYKLMLYMRFMYSIHMGLFQFVKDNYHWLQIIKKRMQLHLLINKSGCQ